MSKKIKKNGEFVIGLDVGGTTISSAAVGKDKKVVPANFSKNPIDNTETFEKVLNSITSAAEEALLKSKEMVAGVGIGMPGGPNYFDHEKGISYVKTKFANLYGKDLKSPLEGALGLPVFFLNDAEAFALGAWWAGEDANVSKMLCITLGTGIGSCFISDGVAIRTGPTVPSGGEIWDTPWRGKNMEDFISKDFLEKTYADECKKSAHSPRVDTIKEMAEIARRGDKEANTAFEIYGENLGLALAQVVPAFSPDKIVLGGQISKAFDIFGEKTKKALENAANEEYSISVNSLGDSAPILGAGYHCFKKLNLI